MRTDYDTSPYGITDGDRSVLNNFNGSNNPYNAFDPDSPTNVVDSFNDWEVEDFLNKNGIMPDSLFGIGNQQKKAERKISKAQNKLEHGHTKAAERKLSKGTAILNRINTGQQSQAAANQQIFDTRTNAQILQQQQEQLNTPASGNQVSDPTQPLSSQNMSSIGSGSSGGMSTGTGLGIESEAQQNSVNADEEPIYTDLPGVLIKTPKNKSEGLFILIGVVLLIIAVIYFYPKLIKK